MFIVRFRSVVLRYNADSITAAFTKQSYKSQMSTSRSPSKRTFSMMSGAKFGSRKAAASAAAAAAAAAMPFVPMFEQFRSELDAHYDTRERIIKASRDITAASKKMYVTRSNRRMCCTWFDYGLTFSPLVSLLCNGKLYPRLCLGLVLRSCLSGHQKTNNTTTASVQHLGQSLDASILDAIKPHNEIIKARLESIAPDLESLNAFRYAGNISGGIQELEEAVLFQHYLETQTIMSFDEAKQKLAQLTSKGNGTNEVWLTHEDYILGLYDMTGELMRFAITSVAVSADRSARPVPVAASSESMDVDGKGQIAQPTKARTPLDDLREARFRLDLLDLGTSYTHFNKDAASKAKVTHASVEKVEKAVYGMIVRGSERPAGW